MRRASPGQAAHIDDLIDDLCAWFARHARDLPWRKRRTGYSALVAETMLQQTQVARVVERYRDFMRQFPRVSDLAAADEQAVLGAWRGLGYYRRARLLHAAAKLTVAEHGGRVPRTAAALRRLPGVGRYTAGAIASLVFGQSEPIVDGNVKRVLTRVFGGDRREDDDARWTWSKADELVSRAKRPGEFNEALMELGALVCTPRAPRCGSCPLSQRCATRQHGAQACASRRSKPIRPRHVHHHAIVVKRPRDGRLLLQQRPTTGMWAGMWQAPTIESPRPLSVQAIRAALPQITRLTPFGSFDHRTTHRLVTFHVFAATSRARQGTWLTLDEALRLPLGNAQRRVLNLAADRLARPRLAAR